MAFFQNSVLNKHLKVLDKEVVNAAYTKFKEYFHNPEIQQNIRDAKEEQFQEGFLRELFVKILGYTINPQPNYNLTTELKNEKGAKKADGAILQDGKALAVIELKGTDTKDLDKINTQAFNYKNNQSGCIYVITSNFEKLRFFIHNAVDHVEFNLFTLTEQEFELLWLCLRVDNLLDNVPLKVKEESLLADENITRQLYKDYSTFKTELWQNMVKNHPGNDQLLLYKKTQKLLDRFLFIFFAEDSGLLPPNSISRIVDRWKILQEEDAYKPLYEIFKQYFGYINTGRKGKTSQDDIFAYNGGLFFPDLMLDNIVIDDDLLHKHVMKLTAYYFQSEIDVNILGHIFENSLNEIENVIARLEGREVDKSKTKRKKEGVYYTPRYITKYIVDNTVGKLCEEKKAELGVVDEEYAKGRRNRKKETIKKLDTSLKAYREWLLNITVCDPACGSGAFLNQALEFLMREHNYIDELNSQLFSKKDSRTTQKAFGVLDVANHILEKNLYGVDINEESIDIAKLSLWLRTAQRGRKLTTLNNNLKCGNSLIDDPAVAGEKAFNWNQEFPDIFSEKEKEAFHITTATHDSRTSQRMIDHKVRLKRDNGKRPKPEPIWLELKDELLITETVAEIVKKDDLNVLAYNICGDHMHLLLVCEEEEVPKIVGKIKAVSSRKYNIEKGITIPATSSTRGPVPLLESESEKGHVPLSGKETKKHNSLWTQKFGCKEIEDEKQLWNTIEYINTNREKHELDSSKGLQSLVGSICCDYDHAFRTEYKGGFDVVIGNPPYVRAELLSEYRDYFEQHFKVFNSASDLFAYFYEIGSNLIKKDGVMGYISNTFDKTTAGKVLREYLSSHTDLKKYIDFTEVQVFEDVTTYPVIIILNKNEPTTVNQFRYIKIPKSSQSSVIDINLHNSVHVVQNTLKPDSWAFLPIGKFKILTRIANFSNVRGKYGKCFRGLITGLNEAFILKNEIPVSNHIKYIYEGKEIKKWHTSTPEQKLILFKSKWTKATYGSNISEEEALSMLKADFPELIEQLIPFEEKAKKRYDKGEFWWELRNCAYYDLFDQPKIIFPNLQNSNKFCLDSEGVFINAPAVFLPVASKTLLCILNSKIVWEFLKSICVVRSGGYIEVKPQYFEQIPIPDLKNEKAFEQKTDSIINCTSELQNIQSKFLKYLQSQYSIETFSKKLQNWHELDFGEFISELNKAIKKENNKGTGSLALTALSKKDEIEWMELFEDYRRQAQTLKSEIEKTDKEIDQMVYELYGLSEAEIKVVEGN